MIDMACETGLVGGLYGQGAAQNAAGSLQRGDVYARPIVVRHRDGYCVEFEVNGMRCLDIQAALSEIEDILVRQRDDLREHAKRMGHTR